MNGPFSVACSALVFKRSKRAVLSLVLNLFPLEDPFSLIFPPSFLADLAPCCDADDAPLVFLLFFGAAEEEDVCAGGEDFFEDSDALA